MNDGSYVGSRAGNTHSGENNDATCWHAPYWSRPLEFHFSSIKRTTRPYGLAVPFVVREENFFSSGNWYECNKGEIVISIGIEAGERDIAWTEGVGRLDERTA